MSDVIGWIVVTIGVAFNLFGCIGLVRLPDVYDRLQAATKSVTLGTCGVLLGVAILSGGALALKALVCIPFVFITAPTAAHALARGAHRFGVELWEGSVGDAYAEQRKRP